jgi:hypothetical protein
MESATSDDDQRIGLSIRLFDLLKANWFRVFLASHVSHLLRKGTQPGEVVERSAIARRPYVDDEQDAPLITRALLAENIRRMSEADCGYEGTTREVEESRETFARSLQEPARLKELRNDFCDALYVFAGASAHELWTSDEAMADAVRLLFPETMVRYVQPRDVNSAGLGDAS